MQAKESARSPRLPDTAANSPAVFRLSRRVIAKELVENESASLVQHRSRNVATKNDFSPAGWKTLRETQYMLLAGSSGMATTNELIAFRQTPDTIFTQV